MSRLLSWCLGVLVVSPAVADQPAPPRQWEFIVIHHSATSVGHAEAFDASHRADCRLVARDPETGRLLGWTALSPFSSRDVHRGVAYESVYVAADARGTGIGRALLGALIAASEAAGVWTLLAGIHAENAASLALHERVGFRRVGVHRRLAQDARGRWRDIVIVERRSPLVGGE